MTFGTLDLRIARRLLEVCTSPSLCWISVEYLLNLCWIFGPSFWPGWGKNLWQTTSLLWKRSLHKGEQSYAQQRPGPVQTSRILRVDSYVKCTKGHDLRQTHSRWWIVKDRLKNSEVWKIFCVEIKFLSFISTAHVVKSTIFIPFAVHTLIYQGIHSYPSTCNKENALSSSQ